MLIIEQLIFDTSDLIAAGESRALSFSLSDADDNDVEKGTRIVNLQVFDNSAPAKFYDFISKTFSDGAGETTKYLQMDIEDVVNIVFPASSSATYGIYAFVLPDAKIEFSKQASPGKNILRSNFNQIANTTLTVTPATANSSTYKSFTTITRAAPVTADPELKTFSFTIENVDNDGNGFGIIPTTNDFGTIPFTDSDFYFQTTEAVADNPEGDGEDSTTVTVASVADLTIGATLYYHKGTTVPTNKAGSAVGTTTITDIDSQTLTLTFSQAVAFEDTETMTFRAYGSELIESAIGTKIETSRLRATPTVLTKTVRAAVSNSTTVTLDGTYGIAKTATIKGLDVNNSSTNALQSVSASSSAGSAVVQVNQTLVAGAILTFEGCNKIVTLTGSVNVIKQPSSNRTINIDIDNFLTPGVGS